MPETNAYADYVYVLDILASGNEEQFVELEYFITNFPKGIDGFTGRQWITHAIDCGSITSIKWMLDRKVDLHFFADDGYSPLHSAIVSERSDKHEVLDLLLANGAPIDIQGTNDWTPAHMAAIYEDIESLRLLIKYGANLNIKTRIDEYATPLEEAMALGKQKSVQFLRSFPCSRLPLGT